MSIRRLEDLKSQNIDICWIPNLGIMPKFDEEKYQLLTRCDNTYFSMNEMIISNDWSIYWKFPKLNKHRIKWYAKINKNIKINP